MPVNKILIQVYEGLILLTFFQSFGYISDLQKLTTQD